MINSLFINSEDEPEIRTDKRRTPKEAKGDSGRAPVTDPRHRSPDSSQAQSFSSKCGAEPRFAEEDYIVFCFRENGEIHMITEGKSPEACHELTNTNTTPTPTIRPINRKVYIRMYVFLFEFCQPILLTVEELLCPVELRHGG